MSNERKFPIYAFTLILSENGWSTRGSRVMLPEELDDAEMEKELQKFVGLHLDREREDALHRDGLSHRTLREAVEDGAIEILDTSWEFLGHDTWCCTWFNHYTYNIHLSDDELRDSFERFVRKHARHERRTSEGEAEYNKRVAPVDRVCLMGARDRWRWEGPCRCEHCTAQGTVRFNH